MLCLNVATHKHKGATIGGQMNLTRPRNIQEYELVVLPRYKVAYTTTLVRPSSANCPYYCTDTLQSPRMDVHKFRAPYLLGHRILDDSA